MQRDAIVRGSRARGELVVRWYAEKASAATMQRAELARLRADARAGIFRTLYVYRLDRLSRSGIRDVVDLIEELRRHGVKLVSLADGFDVDGPAWEIVGAVLAWAAKMERAAIAERMRGARARVEAEGRSWGRPRRMTAEQEQRARELAAAGRSHRAIAMALHVPRATISRALARLKKGGGPAPSARQKKPGVRKAKLPLPQ